MAGSTCPVEVMKRVVAEMNMAEVAISYGMTETSPVSTMTRVDDDLARLDEQGYIRITGRSKDVIIRGGENIYCVEVENTLFEHPSVLESCRYLERVFSFEMTLVSVDADGRIDPRAVAASSIDRATASCSCRVVSAGCGDR